MSEDEGTINETKTMVTEGIKSEVSCMVKEFGLERVDALRCSSIVIPITLVL